jgi:hypothetical protein
MNRALITIAAIAALFACSSEDSSPPSSPGISGLSYMGACEVTEGTGASASAIESVSFDSTTLTFSTQNYADANCNTTSGSPVVTNLAYLVGSQTTATNSSNPAYKIDLTDIAMATQYTIFQLSGGASGNQNLTFGEDTTGKDGSSDSTRHDTLGSTPFILI